VIGRLPHYISEKSKILEAAGIGTGGAEIELILCHVLGLDRLELYLHGTRLLNEDVLNRVDAIVQRRATRYPLQYILGEAWFYGRRFSVSPAVMVPTPETELLCQYAVGFVSDQPLGSPRILELGVGCGVIAVTVACEVSQASVLAVDVSAEAIEIARRNARECGVADAIEFRRSDVFSAVKAHERFDLIVSNPPYIRE
jgi:release factor glutamine methyltransferase